MGRLRKVGLVIMFTFVFFLWGGFGGMKSVQASFLDPLLDAVDSWLKPIINSVTQFFEFDLAGNILIGWRVDTENQSLQRIYYKGNIAQSGDIYTEEGGWAYDQIEYLREGVILKAIIQVTEDGANVTVIDGGVRITYHLEGDNFTFTLADIDGLQNLTFGGATEEGVQFTLKDGNTVHVTVTEISFTLAYLQNHTASDIYNLLTNLGINVGDLEGDFDGDGDQDVKRGLAVIEYIMSNIEDSYRPGLALTDIALTFGINYNDGSGGGTEGLYVDTITLGDSEIRLVAPGTGVDEEPPPRRASPTVTGNLSYNAENNTWHMDVYVWTGVGDPNNIHVDRNYWNSLSEEEKQRIKKMAEEAGGKVVIEENPITIELDISNLSESDLEFLQNNIGNILTVHGWTIDGLIKNGYILEVVGFGKWGYEPYHPYDE